MFIKKLIYRLSQFADWLSNFGVENDEEIEVFDPEWNLVVPQEAFDFVITQNKK